MKIKLLLLTLLLVSSCNVNTDPNSRIMMAVNDIKPKGIDTHLCHVQFYCGDSIHTFRNVEIDENITIQHIYCYKSSLYLEKYIYNITYNGRLYKSDKIHIFYD